MPAEIEVLVIWNAVEHPIGDGGIMDRRIGSQKDPCPVCLNHGGGDVAVENEIIHVLRSVGLYVVLEGAPGYAINEFPCLTRLILNIDVVAVRSVRRKPAVVIYQTAIGFRVRGHPGGDSVESVVDDAVDHLVPLRLKILRERHAFATMDIRGGGEGAGRGCPPGRVR